MESATYIIITPLLLGFMLDQWFGDPIKLPHLIVGFGKVISFFEGKLNKGRSRFLKGGLFTILFICLIFWGSTWLVQWLSKFSITGIILFKSIMVFYCLSAKTLRMEVEGVFKALEHSLEKGRKQLSRIVGRDTLHLNEQQIKKAALETLAENLNDGVIAPLFWYLIAGIPGMITYKLINTMDSMIGYKTERYFQFGKIAARIDDVVNYIPARLTAIIMLIPRLKRSNITFVFTQGKNHSSPNSGYPEAALACLLNCRFGGSNFYFGQKVDKPYIGTNERELTGSDLGYAIGINKKTEYLMLAIIIMVSFLNN